MYEAQAGRKTVVLEFKSIKMSAKNSSKTTTFKNKRCNCLSPVSESVKSKMCFEIAFGMQSEATLRDKENVAGEHEKKVTDFAMSIVIIQHSECY